MTIKVREYREFTYTKTYEYELEVPDTETAIDMIGNCSYPTIEGTTDPCIPTVELGDECDGRTSFTINPDGTDGDELYSWF